MLRMSRDLGGTQGVRQVMGRIQYAARLFYGDCLFATISPNEQHSALVLHLSRGRRNDPFVTYGNSGVNACASQNYPPLAAAYRDSNASEDERASDAWKAHLRHLRKHGAAGDMEHATIHLPEYSLRRSHTAQDPNAVMQAYKIEVYLRLATLLGIRMCPNCPNCFFTNLPCQDKFGNSMRPWGGVFGAVPALSGGTEHQGHGTPHLHCDFHLASVYEYGTLKDVVNAFEEKRFTYDEWRNFHEWYHVESVLDTKVKEASAETGEADWHSRCADTRHNDLFVTAAYLMEHAQPQKNCVSTPLGSADVEKIESDGKKFKFLYMAHAQSVFNRVQHHWHKRTKDGFVPLRQCQRRITKKKVVCKAGFPQRPMESSTVVCAGVAKKLKLRISGRRNAFGLHKGRRECPWQSGTTPSFAVAFQSNTHTLPNWRLPPLPGAHDDNLCKRTSCLDRAKGERNMRVARNIAQRASRVCTGYYCGYTFKVQKVGKKFLQVIANSLDYLSDSMDKKSAAQKWHRITHRVLIDAQHRCVRRTAPEEFNLASGMNAASPRPEI